tara:strand:- start:59 stop:277 length:219 start_codon:yes stop_codon:yes gene_type:complete
MYIEVREKNAKYYVIVRHEDSVEKPMAHFASSSKEEAANVGRQFAKQHKCLIRYTSGGIETPELPTPPQAEG